jgi:hypothetical protein
MMMTFTYQNTTLHYSPEFKPQLEQLQKHVGKRVKLSDGRVGILKAIDGVAGRKDGKQVPNTTVELEDGTYSFPGVDELEIIHKVHDELWEKDGIKFKKIYAVGRRGAGAKAHLIEAWEIVEVDTRRQYKKGSAQERFLNKKMGQKIYGHTWTMCNTNGYHCTSFDSTASIASITCKQCQKVAQKMGLI